MQLSVPISPGELLDKLTILEIKRDRIEDEAKLANIRHEYETLYSVWSGAGFEAPELDGLRAELKRINETLWAVEDDIRQCEASQDFGERFVELARLVYQTNDQRARVKRAVNTALGSELMEEKSYAGY